MLGWLTQNACVLSLSDGSKLMQVDIHARPGCLLELKAYKFFSVLPGEFHCELSDIAFYDSIQYSFSRCYSSPKRYLYPGVMQRSMVKIDTLSF